MMESGSHPHDKLEEHDRSGSGWYFSRKDIEENSPSRGDGVDFKKETYLRKSYCTFLQDLGMRLKVPQVTIATAIVFCHRFFLRQSHAKNDRRTIATVCMFLAGKVEETPHPLKDVILVSYEIIHKKDPAAVQRIKQKEVYEQQKELILLGERLVLATLGFDLNVHHPYKPLVEAIKKFRVAQGALAQVAWNFVNDGLRTSLCLQFMPHHIAAGAIFLAAKFLKVKLPSDGEVVWWQEFDVTPRQLEEVSNQMLELYEQNRMAPPASHGNEADGSGGGANSNSRTQAKTPDPAPSVNWYQGSAKHGDASTSRVDNQAGPGKSTLNDNDIYGNIRVKTRVLDQKEVDVSSKGEWQEQQPVEDGEAGEIAEPQEKPSTGHHSQNESGFCNGSRGGPPDVMSKIDKEKVKAALEKRRKSRPVDTAQKPDLLDDYDLIERELESGVELAAAEDEKMKREKRGQKSSTFRNKVNETANNSRRQSGSLNAAEEQGAQSLDVDSNTEEGELSSLDLSQEYHSPKSSSRKRKAAEMSPPDKESRPDFYGVERDRHRNYRQEAHHVSSLGP